MWRGRLKSEILMDREEDAGGFGHRRHCSSVLEHRRIRLLDDRRRSMCDAPARAAGVFGILRGDAAIASGREKPGRETVSALRLARIWLAPEGVLGCGDGTAGATRQSKRICLTARAISCANASVKRRRRTMRRSLRSLPRWLGGGDAIFLGVRTDSRQPPHAPRRPSAVRYARRHRGDALRGEVATDRATAALDNVARRL